MTVQDVNMSHLGQRRTYVEQPTTVSKHSRLTKRHQGPIHLHLKIFKETITLMNDASSYQTTKVYSKQQWERMTYDEQREAFVTHNILVKVDWPKSKESKPVIDADDLARHTYMYVDLQCRSKSTLSSTNTIY